MMKTVRPTLLAILLCSLAFPSVAQQPEKTAVAGQQRPKVGLVLSGGGAKGFAHIGAIKVLEEEGIPIDLVVGTSIGSLIGGIYSIGYTSDEMIDIVRSQNWDQTLSDDVSRLYLSRHDQMLKQRYLVALPFDNQRKLTLPPAMIKGQNVMNVFCGLAANVPEDADFSQFPIPFACVAGNLENGKEEVLNHGFLPTAMYASMAIPGVFMPGVHDNKLLVDGGVVNNFPVDVAKAMGADIIIGVDIRDDFYTRDQIKSMSEVFLNLINFYSTEKDAQNLEYCDVIIRPDVSGYSGASFSREAADSLIVRGRAATEALRDQLRALKAEYHLEPGPKPSRRFVEKTKWHITKVQFDCDNQINREFLLRRLNLPEGMDYDYFDIKRGIDQLYGSAGFEYIYFTLHDNPTGTTLQLHLQLKEQRSQYIGFRVNTTEAAALLLNATWKNYTKSIGLMSASAELSANPGANFLVETNWHNFPDIGLEASFKYQNYNVYNEGERYFDTDLIYSSARAYIQQDWGNWRTGLAIHEDYFYGDVFAKGSDVVISDETEFWLTGGAFYITYDNQDNFYFPNHGTRMQFEASFDTDWKTGGKSSPYLLLKMENVASLSPKVAFLYNLYGRGILNESYPEVRSSYIGGDVYSRYFNNHFNFLGMPPVMISERFMAIGQLGLRFRLSTNQYLSLLFNTLQQSPEYDRLDMDLAVYGGGIKYSYKTIIGPLDLGLGYSDYYNRVTLTANLGFWF